MLLNLHAAGSIEVVVDLIQDSYHESFDLAEFWQSTGTVKECKKIVAHAGIDEMRR